MKRDMDLIRDVLLVVEAEDSPNGWDFDADAFPGRNQFEIAHHLEILRDAGFVEIAFDEVYLGGGRLLGGIRLTWHGHEFLDDVRSDKVWVQTKELILKQVGSASVSVMGEVARQFGRALLGL